MENTVKKYKSPEKKKQKLKQTKDGKEITTLPSKTVQGDSTSIKDILYRYKHGVNPPNLNLPYGETDDLEDINSELYKPDLDMTDGPELKDRAQYTIDSVNTEIEKQKKAKLEKSEKYKSETDQSRLKEKEDEKTKSEAENEKVLLPEDDE